MSDAPPTRTSEAVPAGDIRQPDGSYVAVRNVDVIYTNVNVTSSFRIVRTGTESCVEDALLQVAKHLSRGLYKVVSLNASKHAMHVIVSTELSKDEIQLFLEHNVYNELALGLLHRHFDLSTSEKLVELGAVSSPWQYAHSDSDVMGVYKPLPDKPACYAELNDLLLRRGLTDLLGLTLNIEATSTDTVKFEKTFDRANVVLTIQRGGQMEAKESVPAQWAYSGVGDFSVPVKK